VLVASCGRAVLVNPAQVSPETAAACGRIADTLPAELAGATRLETHPDPGTTAAWGAPAIVWRCGVDLPPGYDKTSQLVAVNGRDWFAEELTAGTRFTAVGRDPVVEVTVPADYGSAAGVLAELDSPPDTGAGASPGTG
jgi:hypothetical protein